MSDVNTINYLPLAAMTQATRMGFMQTLKGKSRLVSLALVVVGGLVLRSEFGISVSITAVIIYAVWVGALASGYRNGVWLMFAQANGWSVDTTTPVAMLLPPSLQFGHGPNFSPIIQAALGPINCDMYSYTINTGSGKSQKTHYFTIARAVLPRALSHIVLQNKKGPSDIQQDLPDYERLSLEGDFNNYFTLQVQKGKEVDALTIMTPDVMQTIVDTCEMESIEINGTDLYFIVRGNERDMVQIQQLIASVVALDGQLVENIRLSSTAVSMPVAAVAASPVSAPAVLPVAPNVLPQSGGTTGSQT